MERGIASPPGIYYAKLAEGAIHRFDASMPERVNDPHIRSSPVHALLWTSRG